MGVEYGLCRDSGVSNNYLGLNVNMVWAYIVSIGWIWIVRLGWGGTLEVLRTGMV